MNLHLHQRGVCCVHMGWHNKILPHRRRAPPKCVINYVEFGFLLCAVLMRADVKSICTSTYLIQDIIGTHWGGKAQHKGLSFCHDERWTYHRRQRAPNKSPDAPVRLLFYIDISLVTFHFITRISGSFFKRQRNEISLDQSPSYWPHRSSSGNLLLEPKLYQQKVPSTGPPKLFNIRSVSCGRIAGRQRPTAIWLQPFSATLPLCLFLSPSPLPSERTETRQAVL